MSTFMAEPRHALPEPQVLLGHGGPPVGSGLGSCRWRKGAVDHLGACCSVRSRAKVASPTVRYPIERDSLPRRRSAVQAP